MSKIEPKINQQQVKITNLMTDDNVSFVFDDQYGFGLLGLQTLTSPQGTIFKLRLYCADDNDSNN